jgi:hypothetical protein
MAAAASHYLPSPVDGSGQIVVGQCNTRTRHARDLRCVFLR